MKPSKRILFLYAVAAVFAIHHQASAEEVKDKEGEQSGEDENTDGDEGSKQADDNDMELEDAEDDAEGEGNADPDGERSSTIPDDSAPIEKVSLDFHANQDGVILHLGPTPTTLDRVCFGDCTLDIHTGFHHLALSQGAGKPVPVAPMDIRDQMTLEAGYTSRSHLRAAGWIILGVGAASGIGAMITGVGILQQNGVHRDNDEPVGSGTIIGGAITTGISVAVGVILALLKDKAEIFVDRPGVAAGETADADFESTVLSSNDESEDALSTDESDDALFEEDSSDELSDEKEEPKEEDPALNRSNPYK